MNNAIFKKTSNIIQRVYGLVLSCSLYASYSSLDSMTNRVTFLYVLRSP